MLKFSKFKNIKWKIIGEDVGAYPFPTFCYGSAITKAMISILGKRITRFLFIYQNNIVIYCIAPGELSALGKKIMQIIIKDPSFGKKAPGKIINDADELNKYIEKLERINLTRKSNRQIFYLYKEFIKKYSEIFIWGLIPGYLDFEEPILTNYLENFLQRQIERIKTKGRIGEYFTVLTIPTKHSFTKKGEFELLKLAQKIKRNKRLCKIFKNNKKLNEKIKKEIPEISREINKLVENYGWTSYNWSGPGYTREYYLEALSELVDLEDLEKRISSIKKEPKELRNKQKEIYKELKIIGSNRRIFEATRELLYAKAYRKEMGFKANFTLEHLLEEIGRRLYLIPKQIKFLLPDELRAALLENKIEMDKINERIKYCIWVDINEEEEIFSGKEAKKWVANVIRKKISRDIKEIRGQSAYSGKGIKKYS